jgi:DNA polymerase-4
VAESHEIKSVGEQETFPEDTRDAVYILGRFRQMCGRVMGSLKAEGFSSFRRVAVTVRFSDFQTVSRSHTLALASSDEKVLEFQAVQLLMPFFDARENPRRKKVRLVGVRVEKIQ